MYFDSITAIPRDVWNLHDDSDMKEILHITLSDTAFDSGVDGNLLIDGAKKPEIFEATVQFREDDQPFENMFYTVVLYDKGDPKVYLHDCVFISENVRETRRTGESGLWITELVKAYKMIFRSMEAVND